MLTPESGIGGVAVGTSSLANPRITTTTTTTQALTTKTVDLLPVTENKRKFSFPVALHSSSLLSEPNTISARRRFSNVSDVVTRKLSSTIGWKIPIVIPTADLVTQGKCLCGQYIRNRLKRSGLFTKKLGLQRLRSIIGTPSAHIVREVFPALNYVRVYSIYFVCHEMILMENSMTLSTFILSFFFCFLHFCHRSVKN